MNYEPADFCYPGSPGNGRCLSSFGLRGRRFRTTSGGSSASTLAKVPGHFWYQMNVWQNYLSHWLMSFVSVVFACLSFW